MASARLCTIISGLGAPWGAVHTVEPPDRLSKAPTALQTAEAKGGEGLPL